MRKVNRKSIYFLSAAAVALLIGGGATAASAYKTVTLDVDGHQQIVKGFQVGTIDGLLREQGIQVGKEDLVQPAGTNAIAEGITVQVKHAKSVFLQDGTKEAAPIYTLADTVADLLKEQKISVSDTDQVNQEMTAKIESGQTIAITRKNAEVQVAEEVIPFQTERQPDENEYTGSEKVLTPGVEGKAKVTTKVYYENGKEVDRKTEREVVQTAVNQVVSYGTKQRPIVVASRSGETFTASKTLVMAASAYSMSGHRTASGGVAGPGTVAVDPSVIPLGTRLYIEGYGYAVASDIGGAIKGNRIDIHFDDPAQAVEFGRRVVNVYVLQ